MSKLNQNTTGLQSILESANSINTEVNVQTDLIEQLEIALTGKTAATPVSRYNIAVTVDNGATVTATKGSKTVTGTSSNGSCILEVDEAGEWSVYAEIGGVESNTTVVVASNTCFTTLKFFTANVSVSTSEGAIVTASKGSKVMTETAGSSGVVNFVIRETGDWTITATKDGKSLSETLSITEETNYSLELSTDLLTLNAVSWAKIRQISDAGTGRNYWSVGDCKAVHLSGIMGTLSLDTTLWVYILGFDHNKDVEGSGIQFGGFKTDSGSSGVDVCLIDSKYSNSATDGTKYFNMNHWGFPNHGGWARCDMRYDILGSTNVAPKNYGKSPASGDVGYDATSTCATNPVANTLMSCLPAELRAVMKPITKWTNNVGNSGDTEEKVTAMIDYLPLLAEFEIFGTRKYANSYEQNHQVQYEYFSAGNSKKKYRHSATDSTANWWERSTQYNSTNYFCYADSNGLSVVATYFSYGVAPAFMV